MQVIRSFLCIRCAKNQFHQPLWSNPRLSHLLPTLFTIPQPSRLLCHTHTTPMKPLIWTLVIIASHHVARTDAAAGAILAIIPFALCIVHIGIGPFLLAIGIAQRAIIPRIFGWRWFQIPWGCDNAPGSISAGSFLGSGVASAGKLFVDIITCARC